MVKSVQSESTIGIQQNFTSKPATSRRKSSKNVDLVPKLFCVCASGGKEVYVTVSAIKIFCY